MNSAEIGTPDVSMPVYTIGHSNHPLEHVVRLLKSRGIEAVGDVRSRPYSRHVPWFNREPFARSLREHHVKYVHLGGQLGGRSDDPGCYVDGRICYARLSRTDAFQRGLERLVEGSKRYRVALMCAEADPLDCHRTLLIAPRLVAGGVEVAHILPQGGLEPHARAMDRLLAMLEFRPDGDLFRASMRKDDLVAEAVKVQAGRVGHVGKARAGASQDEP